MSSSAHVRLAAESLVYEQNSRASALQPIHAWLATNQCLLTSRPHGENRTHLLQLRVSCTNKTRMHEHSCHSPHLTTRPHGETPRIHCRTKAGRAAGRGRLRRGHGHPHRSESPLRPLPLPLWAPPRLPKPTWPPASSPCPLPLRQPPMRRLLWAAQQHPQSRQYPLSGTFFL